MTECSPETRASAMAATTMACREATCGEANARSVATTSAGRSGAPEWKRTSSRSSTSSVRGSLQRQPLAR